MNKRETGTRYEALAAEYLEENDVRIIKRNYRDRRGEIDIIGLHQGYLVFFEVKYRKNASSGSASEAVGPHKQRQICRTADRFLFSNEIPLDSPVRFDVVAIDGNEITWIRNAFPYIERGR